MAENSFLIELKNLALKKKDHGLNHGSSFLEAFSKTRLTKQLAYLVRHLWLMMACESGSALISRINDLRTAGLPHTMLPLW